MQHFILLPELHVILRWPMGWTKSRLHKREFGRGCYCMRGDAVLLRRIGGVFDVANINDMPQQPHDMIINTASA
jgi:hypothetical protein